MTKHKRWLGGALLFTLVIILILPGKMTAQSSTNFKIKESVLDQGGAPSQANHLKLVEAMGQPSVVGNAKSTNFRLSSGFFANYQDETSTGFWADVDDDGDVDIIDIQLVAAHWNTQVGDANYDPRYDVDNEGQGDGDVDIIDLQLVAGWWNRYP